MTFDEHYLVALDVIKRNFPSDRGLIIDIGAYDADSTVFFAERLRYNTVMGFEPNPEPYERGKTNTKAYPNVKLFNIGFSNKVGEVDLHITRNVVSSSLYTLKDSEDTVAEKVIKVNVDTLDNMFSDVSGILLMKLDVQGAELSILKAGEQTLRKTKLVLAEMLIGAIYDGSCSYYEVDAFLRSRNFAIHTIITNYNKDGLKYFDALYINLATRSQ